MKWYDDEVAYNLLWMKPGVEFWYRQSAVGPVAKGKIVRVDTKKQCVVCSPPPPDDEFTYTFRLGLHEPQHMSTYPENDDGQHFTWPTSN